MSEYIKCPICGGTGELSNGKECEVCDGGMKISDKELSDLITSIRNDSYREGMNDQKLEHVSEPARIDELSHVQLQHGNYLTMTHIDGHGPMSIEERLAQLQGGKDNE